MKISVIIPTYRPGEDLKQCLEALSNQTFMDFEVIVILNGCDYPYIPFVKELMQQFGGLNIKLLHSEKPGVSEARNIGISEAQGEFVAFIDADDLISEGYLEGLAESAGHASIVFSDVRMFIGEQTNLISADPFHKCYESSSKVTKPNMYALRRLMNGPWGKLYRRKDLDDCSFNTSLRVNEDALFNFCFSRKIKSVTFAPPTAIYFYRQNPDGATNRKVSAAKRIAQALRMNMLFTLSYLKYFPNINFPYYLSRIAASWKYAIFN